MAFVPPNPAALSVGGGAGPAAGQVGSSFFGPQAFLALTQPELLAGQAAAAGLEPDQLLQAFIGNIGAGAEGAPGQADSRRAFFEALSGLQELANPQTQPAAPAVGPRTPNVQGFDPRTLQLLLQGTPTGAGGPVNSLGALIRGAV